MSHWIEAIGRRGVRAAVVALAALLLIRVLRALTNRLVQLAKSQSRTALMREQRTRALAHILYSGGTAIILFVAALEILADLGFNITPIEAAVGLGSLALGFGAQHLVRDVISGFIIMFEDQYVVGELIRANGETGRVEDLTLRRTVLRNARGELVTLPNGQIGQVANLSRDWSQTFVDVSVSSQETAGRALAVLEKVAGDFRNDAEWSATLVDGPRVLGVESMTLDTTLLRIQVRTPATRQDDVARELRRRIRTAFEQAHILVTPTQRVEMTSEEAKPS